MAAPREELSSRFAFVTEDGHPLGVKQLPHLRAFRGESPPPMTVRSRMLATGEEQWGTITAFPLRDDAGRVNRVVTIFRRTTEQRRAERTLRVLARAGAILTTDLDADVILRALTRVALPELGDTCSAYLLDEEGQPHVLSAHVDPLLDERLRELHRRFPLRLDGPSAAARVLRTGEHVIERGLRDAAAATGGDDEQRLIDSFGLREAMTVPLQARGRTLGALTFAVSAPGRRLDDSDLSLAKELANRAAQAVDNARLYREAQRAAARARTRRRATSEALRRIGASMASELDAGRLVQLITDEATAVAGARHGAFFQSTAGRGRRPGSHALRGPAPGWRALRPDSRCSAPPSALAAPSAAASARCAARRRRRPPGPDRARQPPGGARLPGGAGAVPRRASVVGALVLRPPASRAPSPPRTSGWPWTSPPRPPWPWTTPASSSRLRDAEASSRDSEERLRLALDAGRMGYFDWICAPAWPSSPRTGAACCGCAPRQPRRRLRRLPRRVHPAGSRASLRRRLVRMRGAGRNEDTVSATGRCTPTARCAGWRPTRASSATRTGRPLRRRWAWWWTSPSAGRRRSRRASWRASRPRAPRRRPRQRRIAAILESIGEPRVRAGSATGASASSTAAPRRLLGASGARSWSASRPGGAAHRGRLHRCSSAAASRPCRSGSMRSSRPSCRTAAGTSCAPAPSTAGCPLYLRDITAPQAGAGGRRRGWPATRRCARTSAPPSRGQGPLPAIPPGAAPRRWCATWAWRWPASGSSTPRRDAGAPGVGRLLHEDVLRSTAPACE